MRRFGDRHPLFFSVAVTLLLFGITFASRAVFPMAPVGDISELPQKALEPPEGLGLILSDIGQNNELNVEQHELLNS